MNPLIRLVADLEEKAVLDLVRQRLEGGEDALQIVQDCQQGMRAVGERYERREYFLSGLIMAGEIFRQVMEMVQPHLRSQLHGESSGLILIGTVEGDIHDIGKNHLSLLLSCYGFSVHDLGVNVPAGVFLAQAQAIRPQIIGLSGLITASYDAMRNTVRLLRQAGDPTIAALPIIIGGSQISQQVCDYVGADYWVDDAMNGVTICQKLVG